jgi:hypothetical protein
MSYIHKNYKKLHQNVKKFVTYGNHIIHKS